MSGITDSKQTHTGVISSFNKCLKHPCVPQHGQITEFLISEEAVTKSKRRTNNRHLLVGGIYHLLTPEAEDAVIM